MSAFIASFVQYVEVMVILAAIAGLGAFIGIKLRVSKDAKESSKTNTEE